LQLTSISDCFIVYSEFNLVEKLSHPSSGFCLGLLRYEGSRILTAQETTSSYFSQTDQCICVWASDCYMYVDAHTYIALGLWFTPGFYL